MSVPDFQSIMRPLLCEVQKHTTISTKLIAEAIVVHFKLTDEELNERLPSGRQTRIQNRIGWARTYLDQSGLIRKVSRGIYAITENGEKCLESNPERITLRDLKKYPAYLEFKNRKRVEDDSDASPSNTTEETIEERMAAAHAEYHSELQAALLAQIRDTSWQFFEDLVVDVLVSMGYGGNRNDAGHNIGKSGDEGIDGIIKDDALGLDLIYIQAKKWDATVGRPEIQKFAGALQGKRARKGVFITTSSFSKGAAEYTKIIDAQIILVDGEMLAKLMIEHGVGVSEEEAYVMNRIDNDYFEEGHA